MLRKNERRQLLIIILVVVFSVILASLEAFILFSLFHQSATHKCRPAPIMLSYTPWPDVWNVTISKVDTDCASNRHSDVIVRVMTPDRQVLVSGTVEEIRGGSTFIEYYDVTPPADRVNEGDYFLLPRSEVSDGDSFHIGTVDKGYFFGVTFE